MSIILSIPNSVHAQSDTEITFDEQICMSIILPHQVQSMSHYPEQLKLSDINSNLETLNEEVTSGCAFNFESDDGSFYISLMLAILDSDAVAQSRYAELLSTSQQSGYPITEGNNGPWIYHLIEFNDKGLGSGLFSIKDNIQIAINAPQVEFLIEPSALVDIATTIQTKIDNTDTISLPTSNLDNPDRFTDEHGISPFETGKFLSPLDQFRNDVPYSQIECNGSLQLIQKHDSTPACVTFGTAFELIKRGWVSDIIIQVQSRIITLDPKDIASSYMEKIIPTLDDFKNILSEPYDIDTIFSKFGDPHYDVGNGINVYVYDLNDGTQMMIGYNGDILYVTNLDLNGNVLEELFVKNSP